MMKDLPLVIFVSTILISSCTLKDSGSIISPDSLHTTESLLGELQHNFTLNPGTQEKFEEGLLLLHNFEYDDALTAFEEATAQDSTEVLTHWGEAMCHYKALWKLQNTEKGRSVLSRFGETKEERLESCLLYTSPSPRDRQKSRMPSSA